MDFLFVHPSKLSPVADTNVPDIIFESPAGLFEKTFTIQNVNIFQHTS